MIFRFGGMSILSVLAPMCTYLMASASEQFFMCLLTIGITSYEECLFAFFTYLLAGLFVLLLGFL